MKIFTQLDTNNWSPNMDVKILEKTILDFIKANNASCNLNALFIHLFPFMRDEPEPTVLTMPIVTSLITSEKIKINEKGMFEIIEEPPLQQRENKTMNTETKQPVFTVSEEQSKTLLLIKERFKSYFGIDLTFEQTMDRAFRIVQEQIEPERYCSVQKPINNIPFNPPNFNNWVRPPGWNEGVARCGNSFNAPQHFNHTPFPNPPPINNQGLDFNSLFRGKPSQAPQTDPFEHKKQNSDGTWTDPNIEVDSIDKEGPYAFLYPGFVNMLLPQRNYGSRKDVRDIANCINTMLTPQEPARKNRSTVKRKPKK